MSFEFPGATYIFPMESLTEATASPTLSGELGIIATFDAEFSATFQPFTASVAGLEGILRVCGEQVSRIFVQTAISGKVAMLPLENPDDAARLVDVLKARTCDPMPDS